MHSDIFDLGSIFQGMYNAFTTFLRTGEILDWMTFSFNKFMGIFFVPFELLGGAIGIDFNVNLISLVSGAGIIVLIFIWIAKGVNPL